MFQEYLQAKKQLLLAELTTYIATQKSQNTIIASPWKIDALNRIYAYMQNGKMIRGALVYLGYDMQTDKPQEQLSKLALAMEFFHSALLMHDDIYDHASLRRGNPTIHTAYTDLLQKRQSRFPKNTGVSLGICVGDIAYGLGMQLLADVGVSEIMTLCAKELQTVNYAQMADIVQGASNKPVEHQDEILSLYKQKTGRYSVFLPLAMGAVLGNAKPATLKHIAKCSDEAGVAFQLVDDILDLFGDPKKTGKAVGTDVREGKQTLAIFLLRQTKDPEIQSGITKVFAKGDITDEDIEWVKTQMVRYHIDTQIHEMIETYAKDALASIARIPMSVESKNRFASFVEYLTNRIQ